VAIERTGYRKESLRRLIYKRSFYLSMLGAIIIVLLLGSLLMFLFERNTNPTINTYGDAVWLSVVTMTTVGYGDKYPITPGGKATGMVSMVLGIALVTTAITARAAARIDKAKRRSKGLDKRTALSNHFLVCGWNSRGRYVLERLIMATEGDQVPIAVLCDLEENPFEHDMVFFYGGSPASEKDLRRVNVDRARAIVILADDTAGGRTGDIDARTVLCTLAIKSLNNDAKITAEVLEPENTEHLKRAGVGEILDYNLTAGNLLGQSAIRYGLLELINTLSTKESSSRVYQIPVEKDMVGIDNGEVVADLKRTRDYNLLAIKRAGKVQICDLGCTIEPDDLLLVLSGTKPPTAVE
jgi:voltage-gated potassium channel